MGSVELEMQAADGGGGSSNGFARLQEQPLPLPGLGARRADDRVRLMDGRFNSSAYDPGED
jgi:hypothetical protein